ncbi:MAG: DUF4058 family protein [Anaerolineae bacterium]|nr:DUF4058 family protein [Candidatus Roseilinea sp.]MDW8451594.1 DUF4058 family protein [Anaerolineae bacterium]
MPSPFPGMNPYFEHPRIWEDFHANLAAEIQRQLAPRLRPKYYAALTPRVTYDEIIIEGPPPTKPEAIKPDVGIYRAEAPSGSLAGAAVVASSPPIMAQVPVQEPITLHSIEICEVGTDALVTAIEILSPVNKRPGHEAFDEYAKKRRHLMRAPVNLLEIDLLRAGVRMPVLTELPDAPYFIFLHRAFVAGQVEVWPVALQQPIPVVPVPLREPDPDVPLDLTRAIHTIYDELSYDMRIDYKQDPPPPPLAPADQAYVDQLLAPFGRTPKLRRLREDEVEYEAEEAESAEVEAGS